MNKITLIGEPKSTQTIYKVTCRGKFGSLYMSKQGKDIKDDYYYQVKSQWRKQALDSVIGVDMHIFMGTKRKCDIDNFNKLAFDSLTGIVWNDDSQIKKLSITMDYDKVNPRIELVVREL